MYILDVHSDARTLPLLHHREYVLHLSTRWATPPSIYACLFRLLSQRRLYQQPHIIYLDDTLKTHWRGLKDLYQMVQFLLLHRVSPFQISIYTADAKVLLLRVSRKEEVDAQ